VQGYITSIRVSGRDPNKPDSPVYNNIFHHNVPDVFEGVSIMFNIGGTLQSNAGNGGGNGDAQGTDS
jgi:hypothetical protein